MSSTRNSGAGSQAFQAAYVAAVAAGTMHIDSHMTQLSCGPGCPGQDTPSGNHPATDAGTDGKIYDLPATTASTKHVFGEGGSIGIILYKDGDVEVCKENIL